MATSTVALTRNAWVDLGPAPFRVLVTDANDAAVLYVSDTAPDVNAIGYVVNNKYWQGFVVNGSAQHVWARALNSAVTVTLTEKSGSVDLNAAQVQSLVGVTKLVATRGMVPNGLSNVTGTYTRNETRLVSFVGKNGASDIRLVYGNYYCAGGLPEQAGPNDIVVQAAIETSTGTVGFAPVTFGGQLAVTIKPGTQVVSDPVGLDFGPNEKLKRRDSGFKEQFRHGLMIQWIPVRMLVIFGDGG